MELSLDIAGQSVGILQVVALGCGVGFIAGMFGVGGGFLLVPLMHVLLGIPIEIAVAAGLCQTIATALPSHLRHRKFGHAETRFDILLLGGSLLGVDAGIRLLSALHDVGSVAVAGKTIPVLKLVVTGSYLLIFFSMAFIMWFKSTPVAGEEVKPGPFARVRLPGQVYMPVVGMHVSGPLVSVIGFMNGVFAGMLGIGGGIVLIPIMLYGFGFDIRRCAGTGIVMVIAVAVLGTFREAQLGNVHLDLAMTLMVGAAVAAQIGANMTRDLPAVFLRKGLAVVLVITNGALLFKLLR